jgi:hypothetical protein
VSGDVPVSWFILAGNQEIGRHDDLGMKMKIIQCHYFSVTSLGLLVRIKKIGRKFNHVTNIFV